MATILTIAGADFSSFASGFAPPVAGGLEGWFFLGGSAAASTKNYAFTGDAAVAGSPVFQPGYATFNGFGSGQWIDTQIHETASLTVLLAVRSAYNFAAGTGGADSGEPCFFSNGGADPTDTADTGQRGCSLYADPSGSSAAPAALLNAYSGDKVSTGTGEVGAIVSLPVQNLSRFSFIAMTIDGTALVRSLYDATEGTSAVVTSDTNPRLINNTIPFRIGANQANYFTGPCDIAFAAFYSRALAAAEITKAYSFVQARMQNKFGLAI